MNFKNWNKSGKKLELSKINKMIQDFLSKNLELSKEEFSILKKVSLSLQEEEEKMTYVPVPPPLPTTIKLLKPPMEHKPQTVKKDPNMTECIKEMQNNKLFLKMHQLCEVEVKIKIPEQEITAVLLAQIK